MSKKKVETNLVADLIKAKNAAGQPKKGNVPELNGYEAESDEVAQAYTQYRDSEAAFRAVEGQFLVKVQKLYEGHAKEGQFSKSFNFPGASTSGVQVTYQDKWSAIPLEAEPELQACLGESYSRHFHQKRVISLERTDDETITLLVNKLGVDLFGKIFKLVVTLQPNADMDSKQFDLPEQARALLKQYKASIKLLKE